MLSYLCTSLVFGGISDRLQPSPGFVLGWDIRKKAVQQFVCVKKSTHYKTVRVAKTLPNMLMRFLSTF